MPAAPVAPVGPAGPVAPLGPMGPAGPVTGHIRHGKQHPTSQSLQLLQYIEAGTSTLSFFILYEHRAVVVTSRQQHDSRSFMHAEIQESILLLLCYSAAYYGLFVGLCDLPRRQIEFVISAFAYTGQASDIGSGHK